MLLTVVECALVASLLESLRLRFNGLGFRFSLAGKMQKELGWHSYGGAS